MPDSPTKPPPKWHHPSEVMKLHALKRRQKALQARITASANPSSATPTIDSLLASRKRKNPFAKASAAPTSPPKRHCPTSPETSCDAAIFHLLHKEPAPAPAVTTFEHILKRVQENEVVVVQAAGEAHPPLDWSLKTKMRLFSPAPFAWSYGKLKISEEASGTTASVRCLATSLDRAPNAIFHQCCHLWQQPALPWLSLFPRSAGKASQAAGLMANGEVKMALQTAFADSFRSLFALIRTKQCPYFYVCANTWTCLFRAAGICGIGEMHAVITPTTRGFRQMLRKAEIEFSMPLKRRGGVRVSDQGYETLDSESVGEGGEAGEGHDDEEEPEEWLKDMGINAEDIKQINYTQAKIVAKSECQVDNSDESLILVSGIEVHGLYNILINCKSATATTGPLAGIPPTLLAPVAFNGATLRTLKVRENKIRVDNVDYHAMEIHGPILPSTITSIFSINPRGKSVTASFASVASTLALNKVVNLGEEGGKEGGGGEEKANVIFSKENLSDCGLNSDILGLFCRPEVKIASVECLKYNAENQTYTWS